MNFITKQQKTFQNLVTNYFVTNYKLKPKYISNASTTQKLQEGNLYIYKNNIILSNKIVKAHYNTKELQSNNYTLFNILYKNIHYKKRNDENISDLPNKIRKNIIKDKKKLDLTFKNLEKKVGIIGRKYKNEKDNEIMKSAVGLKCLISEPSNNGIRIQNKKVINNEVKIILTKEHKMKFMDKTNNQENRIYLDLEYINDIYDDFNSFPISNDNSMIFMIGLVEQNGNYINFTTDKLNKEDERMILERYIKYIIENTKNEKLFIYHWSSADYIGIIKGLERHPELKKEYHLHSNKVEYIDLLKIVKEIIEVDSYSLKYISKVLLNMEYTSDCKNGFDAMISIIRKNAKLNKNQGLLQFDETQDIIKYNQMDTVLLLELTKLFTLPCPF